MQLFAFFLKKVYLGLAQSGFMSTSVLKRVFLPVPAQLEPRERPPSARGSFLAF